MALHIKMRDAEKMILNGAVVVSRGSTHLLIENQVSVLRGRDIMSADEATTPARRLYFACTLAYIDEANLEQHQERIVELLGDLLNAMESAHAKATCVRFGTFVAQGNFYQALAECRELIRYEAEALTRLPREAA